MRVVGEYCLVEPFDDEQPSLIELTARAEEARLSLIGKVIAIGDGEKIEGSLKVGDIVHRKEHPLNLNLALAGKVIYKIYYPDGIAVIYSQSEYDQLMVDEKEEKATIAARERIVSGL